MPETFNPDSDPMLEGITQHTKIEAINLSQIVYRATESKPRTDLPSIVENPNDLKNAPENGHPVGKKYAEKPYQKSLLATLKTTLKIQYGYHDQEIPITIIAMRETDSHKYEMQNTYEMQIKLNERKITKNYPKGTFTIAGENLTVNFSDLQIIDGIFRAIILASKKHNNQEQNPIEPNWTDYECRETTIFRGTEFPQSFESFAKSIGMVTKGALKIEIPSKQSS